tara:strand:+ start:1864 stop:2265 length:402 start_codon:yes stop_codon:yes gene_type:complete
MDKNNRPEDIGDYLSQLHGGSWFGFTDSKNKIYSNLILHPKVWNPEYTGDKHEEGLMDNPYSKPTEKECTDGLKAMQDAHDAQEYARTRATSYPNIQEQLDLLYHDMTAGKGDKTGEWYKAVNKVKTDNPKPE